MKQKYWFISLSLTALIFMYSFYFMVLPLKQSIHNFEIKNQILNSQVTAQKAQNKGQGELNTEEFYHWFLSAHFANLKIQNLTATAEGLEVSIAGPSSDLMKLLASLTESRFTHLKFSDLHEIAQLQINFTGLAYRTAPPDVKGQKPISIHKKITPIVVGQVHRQGQCFDVIILAEHSTLRKNPKC